MSKILYVDMASFVLTIFVLLNCLDSAHGFTPRPKSDLAYFDTDGFGKIIGMLVANETEVEEVVGFSNAFATFSPDRTQILNSLKINRGRLLPVIEMKSVVQDLKTGTMKPDYLAELQSFLDAIKTVHHGPVLFMADEPLWAIREACDAGQSTACAEIADNYRTVLKKYELVSKQIRQSIPGSGLFHVEAYLELEKQMLAHKKIFMLTDAEYLGMDCYGPFENCEGRPQTEYIQWVVDHLQTLENQKPIGRKIMLVPGAFQHRTTFSQQKEAIDQLKSYFKLLDSSPLFGGIGVFVWSNLQGNKTVNIGARSLPLLRPYLVNEMRSRVSPIEPVRLPPVMSTVAAYEKSGEFTHASFTQVTAVPGAVPHFYLQKVGMDQCVVEFRGQQYPAEAPEDGIVFYEVPKLTTTTSATAICRKGADEFRQTVTYVVE